MGKYIQLSVHQLVDFLLRTGDIDNRVFNRSTMTEGSRLHSFYQSQQDNDYYAEYALKTTIVKNEIEIQLEGRADGIVEKRDGTWMIDEVKTTVQDLEEFFQENREWHLGQAKCYGYMFGKERNLESIEIRLTYIRQGKEKDRLVKHFTYSIYDLEQYVYGLLDDYLLFYNILFRKMEDRNESIKELDFPFDKFRQGQKLISKQCYLIAKNGGVLFCEAPTGIGKTMSTLYPFIKSMEIDEKEKIFYLTAKGSGKENAYNAIKILKEKGLSLSQIVVTAKDKICFCKDKACNPDECPFAKGYYNKIQTILSYAIVNYSDFDLKLIEQLAYENSVCPFELELDLSLFCDVVICDYNYMFHPTSYMKRYFDEDSSHFLALVDEAHNLVDRSRDMYSASLSYKDFVKARKTVKHSKLPKLKNTLSKVNKMFKECGLQYVEGENVVSDFPDELYKVLTSFVNSMQDINKDYSDQVSKQLLDFYIDVNQFLKISEIVNDKYLIYVTKGEEEEELEFNFFCMDASGFLSKILQSIKGSVFFSATLTPLKYYMDTLGGDSSFDPSMVLPSPFPKQNLKILIAPKVSIRQKDRESSYEKVKDYIEAFVSGKVGNYFVYVPSYEYLEKLTAILDYKDFDIFIQQKDMNETAKQEFLENFQSSPSKTTIGFVVIGGAFGEGIDLISDRLIGAVIVGIGLPRINFRSDKICEYFKEIDLPGYSYAYLNPAMNKVMQAIGRVIRSESDRGAVLLIDDRYMNREYKALFKEEWRTYDVVYSEDEIKKEVTKFFNE